MGFLKGVKVPGFFWVLFIALLGASTYKVQYGEVAFFIILALFAALKLWQMWNETKRNSAQAHIAALSPAKTPSPIVIETDEGPYTVYGVEEINEPDEEGQPMPSPHEAVTVKGESGKVKKFFLS